MTGGYHKLRLFICLFIIKKEDRYTQTYQIVLATVPACPVALVIGHLGRGARQYRGRRWQPRAVRLLCKACLCRGGYGDFFKS